VHSLLSVTKETFVSGNEKIPNQTKMSRKKSCVKTPQNRGLQGKRKLKKLKKSRQMPVFFVKYKFYEKSRYLPAFS
jgi:hypothetical protein